MSIDPQKVKRYALDPEMSLFSELVEANETLKSIAGEGERGVQQVEIVGAEIVTIKGPKGDDGDKGERGDKGDSIRGPQGVQGERGPKGDRGEQGLQGIRGLDGADGEDGSPDGPEEVVIKVNASIRKIQRDRIEGLDDEMRRIEKVASQSKGGAPGYSLTVQDDGVMVDKFTRIINFTGGTVTRAPDGTVSVPINGGSGFQAATGDVDGVNTVFDFTTAPNVIQVDGVQMQKTASDGTVNWTGTTTVTLTTPPTWDIFAVA